MNGRACLVIGASMGGPEVIKRILPAICRYSTCPVFITQHMGLRSIECFRRSLLPEAGNYRVKIGESLDLIEDMTVYLYPGFGHMRVMARGGVALINVFENGVMRNSIDALFASAAGVYGAGCTGIVLTGMGIDGVEGAAVLKNSGGEVIVQDKDSSLIWSMPSAIVARGLADRVLSIESIVRHVSINRSLRGSRDGDYICG